MNERVAFWRRLLIAPLLLVFLLTATASRVANAARDHKSFAALSARLSEPGGYFDSDNLISNETSYLHVIGKIRDDALDGLAYFLLPNPIHDSAHDVYLRHC